MIECWSVFLVKSQKRQLQYQIQIIMAAASTDGGSPGGAGGSPAPASIVGSPGGAGVPPSPSTFARSSVDSYLQTFLEKLEGEEYKHKSRMVAQFFKQVVDAEHVFMEKQLAVENANEELQMASNLVSSKTHRVDMAKPEMSRAQQHFQHSKNKCINYKRTFEREVRARTE